MKTPSDLPSALCHSKGYSLPTKSDNSQERTEPDSPLGSSERRQFDRRERWLAALFFALIIVLAFPQVAFHGRSLVPTDNLNALEYTFNEANYGPDFVKPEEWGSRGLLLTAPVYDPGGDWWQGEPSLEFFRRAIFSGQFPFWDPSAAAGAPAYANPTSESLFPPQIILSLAGSTSGQKNVYILLLFWTAGFTTYCLLRLHGIRPTASAAGGLIYLFAGPLQQLGPSIFMGQVVACIPLVLLATRWFIDLPTWRRTAGLAGIYAVISLASFPPLLSAAFGGAVFYLIWVVILEKSPRRIALLSRFLTAITLSVGLVAIYYVPVFFVISHTPYVTSWYKSAASGVLAPIAIFDLLSPTATGGGMVYSSPIMGGPFGNLFYIGITGLFLAGLSFGRTKGRLRSLLVSSSTLSVIVLLKIFGAPPVQWIIESLPVLQSIHYSNYFGVLVVFLFSLLAAIGFHRLLLNRPGLQLILTVCVLGIGARSLWVLVRNTGQLQSDAALPWVADYRRIVVFIVVAAVLAAIALLRDRWHRIATLAAGLLLILIFVEGVVNVTYPRQRRWGIFAHPPTYVRAMQQLPRPNRSFVAAALNANLGSAFGIDALDSLYMFSPPRMYDLYQKYAISSSSITIRDATVLPPELVLDRAGIEYVLIRQQLPGFFPSALIRQYRIPYQDDYVCLFQRKRTPRYFFSSEYLVTDPASALTLVSTEAPRKVLLESQPPFASVANRSDDPEPELIAATLNALSLRMRAPRAGLLYIADSYYDGWSARVNGQSVPILPANYAFRALPVPAGDVRVELSYLPVGFIPGAIVSTLSLLGVITLALRKQNISSSSLLSNRTSGF